MYLITLHGFPAAIQWAGMPFVIKLFAPIIECSPIVTPFNTVTFMPNHT